VFSSPSFRARPTAAAAQRLKLSGFGRRTARERRLADERAEVRSSDELDGAVRSELLLDLKYQRRRLSWQSADAFYESSGAEKASA
jgi:hypothetical protein